MRSHNYIDAFPVDLSPPDSFPVAEVAELAGGAVVAAAVLAGAALLVRKAVRSS